MYRVRVPGLSRLIPSVVHQQLARIAAQNERRRLRDEARAAIDDDWETEEQYTLYFSEDSSDYGSYDSENGLNDSIDDPDFIAP